MFCQPSFFCKALAPFWAFVLVAVAPIHIFAADVTIREIDTQIQPEEAPPTLIIGASDQHELALLTEMSILLLEDAGFEVVYLQTAPTQLDDAEGKQNARQSIEQQIVDLQWQYPRESLIEELNVRIELVPNDPNMAWELAAAVDNKYTDFQWLPPVDFYDANTMIIRPGIADDLKTIEDLATYLNSGKPDFFLCVEEGFYEDSEGLDALLAHYGIELSSENIGIADPEQIYEATAYGLCDLIVGRNIDGRVNYFNLKSLSDSRNFFPMYGPALMTRDDVLEQYPQINELLGQLGSYIDDSTMAQLNARIQIGADGVPNSGDEETRRMVAQDFLQELGVLDSSSLIIGTTADPEQRVLGEYLSQLLEESGYNAVEKQGFATTEDVRIALEAGEIDLYVDRIGRALGTHFGLDAETWPLEQEKVFQLVQTLDKSSDILWIGDITLARESLLLISSKRADEGVAAVGDLARALADTKDDQWSICVAPSILAAPYNLLDALQESYDFRLDAATIENVEVVTSESCDLAIGFSQSSSGTGIDGFVTLTEENGVTSLFSAIPVMRFATFDNFPKLLDILEQIEEPMESAALRSLFSLSEIGADRIIDSGDELDLTALVRRLRLQPPEVVEEGTEDIAKADLASSMREEVNGQNNAAIRIGVEETSTRYLATQLLRLLLEEEGYTVDVALAADDPLLLRSALEDGELDLYIESTETALTSYFELPTDTFPKDLDRTFTLIRALDKLAGLTWLTPIPLMTGRTILVDEELAQSGIATLADLEQFVGNSEPSIQLCIQSELVQSAPGRLGSIEDLYGFQLNLKELFIIQSTDIQELIDEDKCDILDARMVESTYAASNFTPITTNTDSISLKDAHLQLIAPVARDQVLVDHPKLGEQIEEAFSKLDAQLLETIGRTNSMESTEQINATQQGQLAEAARGYLCNRQLLSNCSSETVPEATVSDPPEGVSTAERQEIEVQGRALDPTDLDTPAENVGAEIGLDTEFDLVTETLHLIETVPLSGSLILSDTHAISGMDTLSNTITVSNTQSISGTTTAAEPLAIKSTLPITVPASFRVNVRASSSTNSLIVDVLRRGTEWMAIGRVKDSSWLQIELDDGRRAWVSASAVLFPRDRVETLPIIEPAADITAFN